MKYKRIFTIVMDSVGCGEMPDAEHYGDRGADTIGHIAKTVGGLTMPAMEKLGYGNLHSILGVEPQRDPQGYYTKMLEASVGKDTITGYKIVGNKSASGTEILDELGEHHMKTKDMIVYTSADSVLQIAAHEEVFGLEELYRCCEIARELTMKDEWKVGRVIARPFIGEGKGHFTRTSNRHDLALKPFGRTVLNELKDKGYDVISVGKIKDIFDGEGITEAYKSTSSHHGMEQTIELTQKDFTGLCFVNLVDFDAKWGHRRNPQGYAQELEDYDQLLTTFLGQLREEDLVIITADHGNDPCHTGTDHTREMVPLILYSPSHQGSGLLPLANTFANLGATVAENFEVSMPEYGESYLSYLK